MKEEFVPYELALRLKNIGFNEDCFFAYREDSPGKINLYNATTGPEGYCNSEGADIAAPLYQQAFDWLREEHGIWVTFEYDDCDCVEADICWYVGKCFRYGIGPLFLTNELGDFKTYKEAQDACLEKLIEIVKNEKL